MHSRQEGLLTWSYLLKKRSTTAQRTIFIAFFDFPIILLFNYATHFDGWGVALWKNNAELAKYVWMRRTRNVRRPRSSQDWILTEIEKLSSETRMPILSLAHIYDDRQLVQEIAKKKRVGSVHSLLTIITETRRQLTSGGYSIPLVG